MKLVNIHKHLVIVLLLWQGAQVVNAQVWPLEQCMETAIANNKKLELGRNGIQQGKDRKTQVMANRMPKVKLEADYKYFIDLPTQFIPANAFNPMAPEGVYNDAQFGVPHNMNANLQVAMPLYNPQLKSAIKNTDIGVELAELKYQKSKEEILFNVSELYYNAQIVKSQMQFVDDNMANSMKLHETLTLLKEHKLALGTDVNKIALQIDQLKSKKKILQGKYDQILNGMKTWMGVSLDENIDVEPRIEYRPLQDYPNHVTTDIRLVETKKRLLEGEIEMLDKSKLPTVVAYGSYGAYGYGYDKSPNQFLEFRPMGLVGVKATYNLFDGNMAKKKKKVKMREIVSNNLQLELLKDQNALQVRNATLKIAVAGESINATKSQIKFAQEIYDQTILQQKEGLASITDVIMADSALRQAQQEYLAAVIDYYKAELELKNVTGNFQN